MVYATVQWRTLGKSRFTRYQTRIEISKQRRKSDKILRLKMIWRIFFFAEPCCSLSVIECVQCDAIRLEHFIRKCVFTKYEIYEFLGFDILRQSMLSCSSWFCNQLFKKEYKSAVSCKHATGWPVKRCRVCLIQFSADWSRVC